MSEEENAILKMVRDDAMEFLKKVALEPGNFSYQQILTSVQTIETVDRMLTKV